MAASDAKSGAKRVMGSIVGDENRKNMKAITEASKGNVELQAILLGAIKSYQEQQEQGGMKELMKKKARSKGKGQGSDSAATHLEVDVEVKADETLDRNKGRWDKWSVKLLQDLFVFRDRRVAPVVRGIRDRDRLFELLEYSFDIRLHTDKPDRPGTLHKLTLFESMKKLYSENGSRIYGIMNNIDSGFIEWRRYGHYTLEVVGGDDGAGPKLRITSKPLSTTVEVPAEVTQGDATLGQAVLMKNFSQTSAYIQTKSDTYSVSSLFPRLGRQLRRRLSEELGVASAVRAGGGGLLGRGAAAALAASQRGESGVRRAGSARMDQGAPPDDDAGEGNGPEDGDEDDGEDAEEGEAQQQAT